MKQNQIITIPDCCPKKKKKTIPDNFESDVKDVEIEWIFS